jgi:hypothetical protein
MNGGPEINNMIKKSVIYNRVSIIHEYADFDMLIGLIYVLVNRGRDEHWLIMESFPCNLGELVG